MNDRREYLQRGLVFKSDDNESYIWRIRFSGFAVNSDVRLWTQVTWPEYWTKPLTYESKRKELVERTRDDPK